MRILELSLENVKCFDSRQVMFQPGVNFISGKNGAGKTTLVEAIGLCLFNAGVGAKGGSSAYFLRDGAKSGSIGVRFLMNGAEYCMRRRLKAGSMPRRLFDGTGNELDLHGDGDIDAFLRKELALTGDQLLSDLFHQVVGVRQGMLTQPFLQQPQERKRIFEAMLGVERYQNALKNAAGMPTYLVSRIAGHTTEIQVCLSHTADLAETRSGLLEAREALAGFQAREEQARQESQAAEDLLRAMVERQEALEAQEKALIGDQAQHAAQWEAHAVRKRADGETLCQTQSALLAAQEEIKAREAAWQQAQAAALEAEGAKKAHQAESNARLEELAAALREKSRRQSAWEARIEELKKTAHRAKGGQCPFLNIPCTSVPSLEDAAASRVARNEEALAVLKGEVADLCREQEAVEAAQAREQARLAAREKVAHDQVVAAAAARAQGQSRLEGLTRELEKLQQAMVAHQEQETRLREEEQALKAREARIREAQAGADPAALAAARGRLQELSRILGEAEAGAAGMKKEVARLEQALWDKEAYARRQQAAEAARDRAEAVQGLYNGLSAMLRSAGERMAAAYRERLGEQATRLYRDISGDTARLLWMPDYEIQLMDHHLGASRCRVFRQLSGGEQMSAALALRLALLTELAPLGLAFFDEPTANLDGARREALAGLLPRVTRGFEQVFVISHDDTFDSVGDSIVAL